MNIQRVGPNNINHVQGHPIKLLIRDSKQAKFCSYSSKKICQIVLLIVKISLSVLIFPLMFESYRNWIRHSFKKLKVGHDVAKRNLNAPVHEKKEMLLKKCADWNFLKQETIKIDKGYRKIKDKIEPIAPGPAFGHVYNVPALTGVWMPGIAVAAHYLSQKIDVKGLFACQTLEAFQKEFEALIQSPNDERKAFILPTYASDWQGVFLPNTPQHEVTVCIEKKGFNIQIALLDSRPVDLSFNPAHCAIDHELWAAPFNVQELILRPLLKTSLTPYNTQFYMSTVMRQKRYGCAIYCLRMESSFCDTVNFSKG